MNRSKNPPVLCFIAVLALSCLTASARAAEIHVPGDYSTIQEAVDAAAAGDVILVEPGIYAENLDFKGKEVTVKSTYGPVLTLLNGNRLGSTVTFASGEGPGAVLEGFTVTNGSAELGCGILCKGASPSIRNNVITANLADSALSAGGGIACSLGASPVIEGNTITLNGVVLAGGGIYCDADCNPEITNNLIWANAVGGSGGGIFIGGGAPVITQNFIYANTANGDGMSGGGIYAVGSGAKLVNDTIAFNACPGAGSTGGGLRLDVFSDVEAVNCIFWGNTAEEGAQAYLGGFLFKPSLSIQYSDVEGGAAGIGVEPGAHLDWGPGMLDGNPAFLASGPALYDLHLTPASACINMGLDGAAPEKDIDGEARPHMGTSDLGADEYTLVHTLSADSFSLSAAAGGTVHFDLFGGIQNHDRNYMVFASVSGTAPGIPLPGGSKALPLNWDTFTNIVLSAVNLLPGFQGKLNFFGYADATFSTFGPVPGLEGLTLSFAYLLQGPPWDFASNPVNVQIEP